jgi:diacylglycerol kinase (ATP)
LSYARIIVNPVAGAGRTAREWPRIMSLFKGQGLNFEHDITEAPGHAVELARDATRNGYETIISVGGDGTLNEIANGLYQAGANKDMALGIVCTGTGSDYARTVGISRRYEEACLRISQPRKISVDLGVVEYSNNGNRTERVFVNFAGIGFDAEIVRRTTRNIKALGSTVSYLLGLFTTLVSYRNKRIKLIIDGEEMEREVCAVIANNGRYGGGGMFMAPDADLTDGLLDLLIIGDIGKVDLIRSLPRIYKGTHLTHRKVTMKKAREVEIASTHPLSLQADGELLGDLPARFRIIPSALNIIV